MTLWLITLFLLRDRPLQILWKRRLIIFLSTRFTLIKMELTRWTKLLRLKMSLHLTMHSIVKRISTLLSEITTLMTFSIPNYQFSVWIRPKLCSKCLINFLLYLMQIISKFQTLLLHQWSRQTPNKTLICF